MPESRPPVSVVIPCYNGVEFLPEAIDSALAQSYPPLEVLVIDDGSTDDSATIAESYGGPVRVIRQHNQGESVARNRGIDEAKGDWIAFLDADDVWDSEKLELQLETIGNLPDTVCLHTGFYLFGSRNGIAERPQEILSNKLGVEDLLLRPFVHPSTALVRNVLPVRFPEWTSTAEDMIYFAEISLYGSISYIASPLTGYRSHSAQQTSAPEHSVRHIASRLEWIVKSEDKLTSFDLIQIRKQIKQQLIDWLLLAKYQRDWEKYWLLREYAVRLEWNPDTMKVLNERIYPRFSYKIKDLLDEITKRLLNVVAVKLR